MAERAASHRERLNNEIETVIGLLRFAIHQSAARGDHHLVGWMFWGYRQAALDGIRRYKPGFAAELAELEARSKAYVLNMNEQRLKPNPLQGPQKGSIVIGGSVFSISPNGKILRDAKRTTFRAMPVIERWYLLEELAEGSRRSTRDSNLADASDAQFAAATVLMEREVGGPLATICPDLNTCQRSGQSFEPPPDPGPPTKIRQDRADRNAPTGMRRQECAGVAHLNEGREEVPKPERF